MTKMGLTINRGCSRSGGFRPSGFQYRAWCSRQPTGGFTLLEILIAISIFAVVTATIFGSFNFVFGNVEAVENGISDYEMASDGINRMMADLRSLHVSQPPAFVVPENIDQQDPYRILGEITTVGNAEYSQLRFASLSHLPLGRDKRQGIAEIFYYVEKQSDTTVTVKRSDRLDFSEPLAENRNDPIICENVRVLKFTYIDAVGDELDRWDSDSDEFEYATPRAIRIQLTVGADDPPQAFDVTMALPVYRENPEDSLLQTIPTDLGAASSYSRPSDVRYGS